MGGQINCVRGKWKPVIESLRGFKQNSKKLACQMYSIYKHFWRVFGELYNILHSWESRRIILVGSKVADLHTKISGTRPPTGPNSFIFAYIFTVSEVRFPLTGVCPPAGNPGSATGHIDFEGRILHTFIKTERKRIHITQQTFSKQELMNWPSSKTKLEVELKIPFICCVLIKAVGFSTSDERTDHKASHLLRGCFRTNLWHFMTCSGWFTAANGCSARYLLQHIIENMRNRSAWTRNAVIWTLIDPSVIYGL